MGRLYYSVGSLKTIRLVSLNEVMEVLCVKHIDLITVYRYYFSASDRHTLELRVQQKISVIIVIIGIYDVINLL